MSSNGGAGAGDAVTAQLTAILARLGELADAPLDDCEVAGAARVDRIAVLERMRAALAAAQHTEMVAFARAQVEEQKELIAAGRLDPEKLGGGIAAQIGLAAHVSSWQGSRRFTIARALAGDLPETRRLLSAGRISERLAETIVAQTSHLDPEQRRLVDKALAGAGLEGMGFRQAEAAVKKVAYETDKSGYTGRSRTAREDRRVTLRPAPDTHEHPVGAAARRAGRGVSGRTAPARRPCGGHRDGRSRDQVIADTLVERLTGQTRAQDVDVEVGIVIPLDALLDPDSPATGDLVGQGPLPAGIVTDVLRGTEGKRWWRRLFSHPGHGTLLGGASQQRRFDGFLAQLIELRDGGRCRDPHCDAPIRHHDHIRQARAGGPTSFTNGRGVCARGNYTRERGRLARRDRPRRARRDPAHRADHHPHRTHLHQPRRTLSAEPVVERRDPVQLAARAGPRSVTRGAQVRGGPRAAIPGGVLAIGVRLLGRHPGRDASCGGGLSGRSAHPGGGERVVAGGEKELLELAAADPDVAALDHRVGERSWRYSTRGNPWS